MIEAELFDQIVAEARAIADDEATMRLLGIPKVDKISHWAQVRRDRIRELRRLRRVAIRGYSKREQAEIKRFHDESVRARLGMPGEA